MSKKYLIAIVLLFLLLMYALRKLRQDIAANDFKWSEENIFVYVLILIVSVLFAILVDRKNKE